MLRFFKRTKLAILASAAVIALLISTFGAFAPQQAFAAGENYTFKDANTIIASGGSFPESITMKLDNGAYKGTYNEIIAHGSLSRTWSIAGVTKGTTANTYTGTISTTGQSDKGKNITGNITINDPNKVGPAGAGTPTTPAGSGSNTDDEEKPVCETSTNALTYFLCPIYNGLADLSDWILLNIVVPFLRPSPIGLNPDDKATNAVYLIWSDMRVYADIILVILLLIAVISQAYGGGIVETYTAKKMLPRILVGAILINTSIYIVAFAIDMANVIGSGIGDLITAPLVQTGNFKFTPHGVGAFVISGGIATFMAGITTFLAGQGTLLAVMPYILVLVVLPAVLAMLGIFITLILLQGLYMALTIFSPIAFALYAFPNTEKYFQRWWDWLLRGLLVYPIFMTILAISDVFTVLIQKANG